MQLAFTLSLIFTLLPSLSLSLSCFIFYFTDFISLQHTQTKLHDELCQTDRDASLLQPQAAGTAAACLNPHPRSPPDRISPRCDPSAGGFELSRPSPARSQQITLAFSTKPNKTHNEGIRQPFWKGWSTVSSSFVIVAAIPLNPSSYPFFSYHTVKLKDDLSLLN